MISLILKTASVKYPTAEETAAEIDALMTLAVKNGSVVEGIRMPYGQVATLKLAGLTQEQDSFTTYKGIKIHVNG